MSRIGKLPVMIPDSVKVSMEGTKFQADGARGSLSLRLPRGVKLEIKDNVITVLKPVKDVSQAYWGLSRTLIANVVKGVSDGFEKQLEIQGVGYKAQVAGNKMTLNLGYSHPVEYDLPEGVAATIEANIITIKGVDKQQVGQVAAEIRSKRPPEPYKGKGIRYVGENVRRKVGKAAGKAAA